MERATVRVDGVVQSVGFRPFVYRTAVELGLRGTVRNRGDAGVLVELEGDSGGIDTFLATLREEPPPLARVESVSVERDSASAASFETFAIVESAAGGGGGGTIPPDTAMCDRCLADLRDPASRFHGYWATSCVDCGPRFTVVKALPYDRPRTSMAAFPMCDDCRADYEDPADRRYHAQTIACPACGPALRYGTIGDVDSADTPSSSGIRDPFPAALADVEDGPEAVRATASALRGGAIAVVKGIGGAHLVCDATDADAVARLRDRTGRPEKPFAVMAPDVAAAASIASVSDAGREALASPRRPIVLLDRDPEGPVSAAVAPGLHTVGVMLPYSGVHHLLFEEWDVPLVVTSANLPGQPMLVANAAIAAGLADVADACLLHDRRIVARCDDSVERYVGGERRVLRRSRGYVPTPVPGQTRGDGGAAGGAADEPSADRPADGVLALGPELDVAAGTLAGGDCYLTQHVGDVADVATFEHLQGAIDHLSAIAGVDQPSTVAHDSHPDFRTTAYARRLEREGDATVRVAVQHHHAHAASVLAEHECDAAVAITVDGVGYGPDGTAWGGEVLDSTRDGFDRVAGLAPVEMPGGDRATRVPARLLAGLRFASGGVDAVRNTFEAHDVTLPGGDEAVDVVCQQLAVGVNTPITTSAGRFLDAVSALLGACTERTYEGEPAMKLEALATRGDVRDVAPAYAEVEGRPVLDTPALADDLLALLDDGVPGADVAATAQDVLAVGLADLAVRAAEGRGRDAVALTGGVAYNEHVSTRVREHITDAGFTFLANERVPAGDGGIAYGQAAVAAARSE